MSQVTLAGRRFPLPDWTHTIIDGFAITNGVTRRRGFYTQTPWAAEQVEEFHRELFEVRRKNRSLWRRLLRMPQLREPTQRATVRITRCRLKGKPAHIESGVRAVIDNCYFESCGMSMKVDLDP